MLLASAEERQIVIEKVCDHLIDRDDYAALDLPALAQFIDYAVQEHASFVDVDNDGDTILDSDALFDAWKTQFFAQAA